MLEDNSSPGFIYDNLFVNFGAGKTPPFESSLPRPRDFSKALYTFDIGHNDIAYGFQNLNFEQVRASIPNILNNLTQAVQASDSICSV